MLDIITNISNSVFSVLCHNDPEIVSSINGESIILCPRCAGLQFGFFCSTIYMLLRYNNRKLTFTNWVLFLFPLLTFVGIFHWFLGYQNLITPGEFDRLVSGLALGVGVSCFIYWNSQRYKQKTYYPDKEYSINTLIIFLIILSFAVYFIISSDSWLIVTLILLLSIFFNLGFFISQIYRMLKHSIN